MQKLDQLFVDGRQVEEKPQVHNPEVCVFVCLLNILFNEFLNIFGVSLMGLIVY